MGLVKIRSYRNEVLSHLSSQVLAQTAKGFSVGFIGWADHSPSTYPLFCITFGDSRNTELKDVLISAGIHGEEPAGVYALLKFLKEDISDFVADYRFLIFPCINPLEFYIWEVCTDKNLRIGDGVVKSVEKVVPVCRWDRIYKDINSNGVIWYPEGCANEVYAQRTTLEGFLADNYTPQAFTIETPCGWHMDQRVLAHRTALRSILELKRNA